MNRDYNRLSVFCSLLSALLLLIFFSPSACTASDGVLKIGVVPYKSPKEIIRLYQPLASLLEKRLARRFVVVSAADYDQYMQRVYERRYDIIVLGSTFYFKAHDRAGYRAIARGYPSFHAGIITRRDGSVPALEQLRGRSLAAVNSRDRGGYRLQKMALARLGMNPGKDYKVHFRGTFDSVVYAVLNGRDDAGAIRLDILDKPSFAGVRSSLKTIYISPQNPQFPFAVRADMDQHLQEQIRAELIGLAQEKDGTRIVRQLNIRGFQKVDSRDLELLRISREKEATAEKRS